MARTSLYSEYEDGVKSLIGTDELLDSEKTLLNGYFNRWIRYCHEYYPWPELVETEQRTVDSNNYIYWEQGGETKIGMFYNIYRNDPTATQYPEELKFKLDSTGAKITWPDTLSSVYVRFQERVSLYTTDRTQTFPYIFLLAVVNFAYADWLKSDGQNGKAKLEMGTAEELLNNEIEKFERQQWQEQPTRFINHTSLQSRL